MLIEQYSCAIDARNIDGIMAKDMGAWYPETHEAFQDYYNLVDNLIKLSTEKDKHLDLEIIKSKT